MSNLKYDVVSIYCAPRGQTFYFIRNNTQGFFESRGMDLSSMVYFLLFKLRDFRKDHREYVQLLKKGDFDLRSKPYYDEDELISLSEVCTEDENKLFKKREQEIDLSLLDEEDELSCMAYVAQFHPRRNFYNGYSSIESDEHAFVNVLMRELNFNKIMDKLMGVLEKEINTGNTATKSVNDLFEQDDLKYMITGSNGDLWVELFLQMNLPDNEKYQLLYQAQPQMILKDKNHRNDPELIRCALDGVKGSHKKLKALFEKLPAKMKENQEVLRFYDWHRECSL